MPAGVGYTKTPPVTVATWQEPLVSVIHEPARSTRLSSPQIIRLAEAATYEVGHNSAPVGSVHLDKEVDSEDEASPLDTTLASPPPAQQVQPVQNELPDGQSSPVEAITNPQNTLIASPPIADEEAREPSRFENPVDLVLEPASDLRSTMPFTHTERRTTSEQFESVPASKSILFGEVIPKTQSSQPGASFTDRKQKSGNDAKGGRNQRTPSIEIGLDEVVEVLEAPIVEIGELSTNCGAAGGNTAGKEQFAGPEMPVTTVNELSANSVPLVASEAGSYVTTPVSKTASVVTASTKIGSKASRLRTQSKKSPCPGTPRTVDPVSGPSQPVFLFGETSNANDAPQSTRRTSRASQGGAPDRNEEQQAATDAVTTIGMAQDQTLPVGFASEPGVPASAHLRQDSGIELGDDGSIVSACLAKESNVVPLETAKKATVEREVVSEEGNVEKHSDDGSVVAENVTIHNIVQIQGQQTQDEELKGDLEEDHKATATDDIDDRPETAASVDSGLIEPPAESNHLDDDEDRLPSLIEDDAIAASNLDLDKAVREAFEPISAPPSPVTSTKRARVNHWERDHVEPIRVKNVLPKLRLYPSSKGKDPMVISARPQRSRYYTTTTLEEEEEEDDDDRRRHHHGRAERQAHKAAARALEGENRKAARAARRAEENARRAEEEEARRFRHAAKRAAGQAEEEARRAVYRDGESSKHDGRRRGSRDEREGEGGPIHAQRPPSALPKNRFGVFAGQSVHRRTRAPPGRGPAAAEKEEEEEAFSRPTSSPQGPLTTKSKSPWDREAAAGQAPPHEGQERRRRHHHGRHRHRRLDEHGQQSSGKEQDRKRRSQRQGREKEKATAGADNKSRGGFFGLFTRKR